MHSIQPILTALLLGTASGFHIAPVIQDAAHLLHHPAPLPAVVQSSTIHFPNLLAAYKSALISNPLPTKMMTGGTLAVLGDAIAQSRESSYDKRRAASFAAFDMCYRALQNALFPIIVANCHGQFIDSALSQLQVHGDMSWYAAMEQTLASQLGIVPFMYYPVFYCLTAVVQGLDFDGAVKRAQETFLPLMQRNLLFWIPVQFVQFGFIEENLQIPFLSVAGLMWTFILSVMAGSAKSYNKETVAAEDEAQLKAIEKAIFEDLSRQEAEVAKSGGGGGGYAPGNSTQSFRYEEPMVESR